MEETENLRNCTAAYHPYEEEELSAAKKKFLKKYPDALEEVEVFGKNQNEFNRQSTECIQDLAERCKRLETALAAEITARKKDTAGIAAMKKELDTVRLRSTLNSNQVEKIDSALVRYSEKTEDYVLNIAPGARLKDVPKGCREAEIDQSVNMSERIEAIKKAPPQEREQKLHDFEKVCMKAITRELSFFNAYEEIGIDFYGAEKYAEIIYRNLCKNSIYKIRQGSDSGDSGRYFVYCGETAAVPEKAFLKSGMIFLTGQNPFEGFDEKYIEDLRFLNDCGIHSYTALNINAFNALKKAGFRCIASAAAEELASGRIISAVEYGIENAVPAGAEKYSQLEKYFENREIKFARTHDEIMGHILRERAEADFTYECIKSLEKTAAAAIVKNYFGTASIASADISQNSTEKSDLLTGFDYINHFNYADRKALYNKARGMLRQGGLLLFGGKNPVTGIKMRAVEGWGKHPVYEAMWTQKQLIDELEENGFQIRFLIPTGTGLYDQLPPKYKDITSLYIVGASPLI